MRLSLVGSTIRRHKFARSLGQTSSPLRSGWPMAKIDEFLPWAWAQQRKVSLAA